MAPLSIMSVDPRAPSQGRRRSCIASAGEGCSGGRRKGRTGDGGSSRRPGYWRRCSAARASSAATRSRRWPSRAGASARPCAGRISPASCNPRAASGRSSPVQANLRFPPSVQRALVGRQGRRQCGRRADQRRPPDVPRHPRRGSARRRQGGARGGRRAHSCTSRPSAPTPSPRPAMPAPRPRARRRCWQEFPDAIILRPSIVFGPEDEFFNRFAAMARISPLLPLIGGGRTRFQPVFVGDVAAAVAACRRASASPARSTSSAARRC